MDINTHRLLDKLNKIYDDFNKHFTSGLHDVLWKILIDKRFNIDDRTTAFTAVLESSYIQLAIVEKGDSGYLPTVATIQDMSYDVACDIIDDLNKAVFDLSDDEIAMLQLQSFRNPKSTNK